jgi:hypothetical protein
MTKRLVVNETDLANIAAMITAVNGYSSEVVSLIRGQQANHVLWSGTVGLDANGLFSMDWQVPMAAVAWWPAVAAGVTTITGDPPAGAAPTNGPGVWVFPAAVAGAPMPGRIFPALGGRLTIYGTASVTVAGMLAVYSKPQNPT